MQSFFWWILYNNYVKKIANFFFFSFQIFWHPKINSINLGQYWRGAFRGTEVESREFSFKWWYHRGTLIGCWLTVHIHAVANLLGMMVLNRFWWTTRLTLYSPRLCTIMKASCLQVVQFTCPVRGSHTQVLQVNNPTNEECRIVPVLKGGPWRVEPFLDFEPLENKTISITYQPMTMTADGKKDLVGAASHGALSPLKSIWLSCISLSGVSLFFLPWWIRHEVQTTRNCWAPQGGGHHCVRTVCKDSAHSAALRAQLASQETTVKHTNQCCTHWRAPQVFTVAPIYQPCTETCADLCAGVVEWKDALVISENFVDGQSQLCDSARFDKCGGWNRLSRTCSALKCSCFRGSAHWIQTLRGETWKRNTFSTWKHESWC